MKRFLLLFYTGLIFLNLSLQAQSLENNIKERLDNFFTHYQTGYANIGRCRLDHFTIDHDKKIIRIYSNDNFGYQPFTEENTQAIYRSLKQILPGPVNYYKIILYADNRPIEELVPNAFRSKNKDKDRIYDKIEYKGAPWTQNISKP